MDKIKAIKYFIASVEEGSFARAAQRLQISVPAVQKLVGTLEHALGAALLERGSRGVRPTPVGTEYLDRCRPLLFEMDSLAQVEARLNAKRRRGPAIRIEGELDPALDVDQFAFEVHGAILASHQAMRLRQDPRATERFRRAIDRVIESARIV